MEREPAGSAVSDLQKINKELEKLQVSDDESVFSDSPSSTAPESCFGAKARDFQEEQQTSQRQQGVYRDARSHSPAVSLNSSAPSPSTHHRAKVNPRLLTDPHKHPATRVKLNIDKINPSQKNKQITGRILLKMGHCVIRGTSQINIIYRPIAQNHHKSQINCFNSFCIFNEMHYN